MKYASPESSLFTKVKCPSCGEEDEARQGFKIRCVNCDTYMIPSEQVKVNLPIDKPVDVEHTEHTLPEPEDVPKNNEGKKMSNVQTDFKLLDIPMPARRYGRTAGTSKYPFDQLEVGGSCLFISGKTMKQFGATVSAAQKRTGFKFSTREIEQNGVAGIGVWRVESVN